MLPGSAARTSAAWGTIFSQQRSSWMPGGQDRSLPEVDLRPEGMLPVAARTDVLQQDFGAGLETPVLRFARQVERYLLAQIEHLGRIVHRAPRRPGSDGQHVVLR